MPYKSIEKRRAHGRAYHVIHKEEKNRQHKEYYQKNREKLRRMNIIYNATHKAVRDFYRATHKEEALAYREKNKEKLSRRHKEYYQKNREAIIQRTTRYHLENKEWRQKYYHDYYAKIRLESLSKVDPALKCAVCGCDDTRFLEINHIKGGGNKDRKTPRNETKNMILLIHLGKRGIEDLNLLCRACNSVDHLERVYGHSGLKVVWDKPDTNHGPKIYN